MRSSPRALLHWAVYDVLNEEDTSSTPICEAKTIKGQPCGQNATWIDNNSHRFTCKRHAYPTSSFIKKSNIGVKDFSLQERVYLFQQRVQEIMTRFDASQVTAVYIELQPAINPKMVMISHILYAKYIEYYRSTVPVRFIQASNKLKKMVEVGYTGPMLVSEKKKKDSYAERKWQSIEYCKWFLAQHTEFHPWVDVFAQQLKKDDMSDTFLMCLQALRRL